MSRATIDQLRPLVRAKSSGTSLRSHLAVTGQVARALLRTVEYPMGSNILVAAAALHDLGKARQAFQTFLDGGLWRCHEDDAPETIREFIMDRASCEWLGQVLGGDLPLPSSEGQMDDVIAFAVTHHGRRQYSPTENGGTASRALPLASRSGVAQGTCLLTEFDLLYRYRPHGGAVILADQIASALQDGRLGVLVSVDPAETPVESSLADLSDEAGAPVDSAVEAELLPQGNGLQRLLLDGLGIDHVDAIRDGSGWRLVIGGGKAVEIRGNM